MALSSLLESLLFISGEPVGIKKLAKAAGAKEDEVRVALEELARQHEERKGLRVLVKGDEAEMVTHPDNAKAIADYLKSGMEEDLTDATSETLAIVAYKGPLTRAAIDDIRGVNSQYTLRTLLVRGLAERIPHPQDARTFLYRISLDFLKKLGLQDVKELPEFDALSQAQLVPQQSTSDAAAGSDPLVGPQQDVPATKGGDEQSVEPLANNEPPATSD